MNLAVLVLLLAQIGTHQLRMEPMDVPAIKAKSDRPPYRCKRLVQPWCPVGAICDMPPYEILFPNGGSSRMSYSSTQADLIADCPQTFISWKCADKSRILLTAEDGSKHCIKF